MQDGRIRRSAGAVGAARNRAAAFALRAELPAARDDQRSGQRRRLGRCAVARRRQGRAGALSQPAAHLGGFQPGMDRRSAASHRCARGRAQRHAGDRLRAVLRAAVRARPRGLPAQWIRHRLAARAGANAARGPGRCRLPGSAGRKRLRGSLRAAARRARPRRGLPPRRRAGRAAAAGADLRPHRDDRGRHGARLRRLGAGGRTPCRRPLASKSVRGGYPAGRTRASLVLCVGTSLAGRPVPGGPIGPPCGGASRRGAAGGGRAVPAPGR